MGVVVIGGGGGGGGGGNKATADGKIVSGEEVVALFADPVDAEQYARMLNREDARVIPLSADFGKQGS